MPSFNGDINSTKLKFQPKTDWMWQSVCNGTILYTTLWLMTSFYSVASQIITDLNASERLLVRQVGPVLSVLSWSTSVQQLIRIYFFGRNSSIRKGTGLPAYHSVKNSRPTKRKMSKTHWWQDRTKLKYSESSISHCHFVHQKPNMVWPKIEHGPPRL
jgi:hypothetical protein